MAQYVERLSDLHVVLDLVDVDSAKWTQYAERHAWPLSSIYRREGAKLLASSAAQRRRRPPRVLVTRGEAELFVRLAPDCADRVHVIENGVDTDYFAPDDDRPSPYAADEAPIVFTGAMDYWPNVDAVSWFAREVLPRVAQQRPRRPLLYCWHEPGQDRLRARDRRARTRHRQGARRAAVSATCSRGRGSARLARGIQNKVLEAMAMARPVVVSSAAATALPRRRRRLRDGARCRRILSQGTGGHALGRSGGAMGKRARARIVADYSWARNLSAFDKLLETGDALLKGSR